MSGKKFPSWGADKGKNVGGGWLPSLAEVRKYEKLDPIEFDILSHRLYSIINEAR
jgi:hypothetical protein